MKRTLLVLALIVLVAISVIGCGGSNGGDKLTGAVKIDGSSTVFPITEAVAEEFNKENPSVQVSVGVSGTGGGFKKFAAGETDISNASRLIKDSEKEAALKGNIEYIELPVAYDGISIVVNKENTWVDSLTVDELKKLWEPDSKVNKWSDLRTSWPDTEIKLYGPGTDSGTFDYFTEEINGKAKASRSDYTPSEDDNVLAKGIAADKGALGYFGYSYYLENKDVLKVVPIDGGSGAVTPDAMTINDGSYKPLSRPLYVYVSKTAIKRPEVKEFVKFYLTKGPEILNQVGFIKLPDNLYSEGLAKIK